MRLVNQEVVIELVNEEPTEEMISARERFWEKVFVELLPEESSGKAMRNKIIEKKFRINEAAAIIGISPSGVRLLLDKKKLGYYSQERDG